MGLDTDFTEAKKAVETAKIEAELAKEEYVKVRNAKKRKKGNKGDAPGTTTETASPALVEAKASYDKFLKVLKDAKLPVSTASAKPFKLYGNLLSDKARQPWEKIIKAQVTKAPWEDIKGVPHTENPKKTCGTRFTTKWQTQYDLTENTTLVSTRALLLVLENIENNAELDNEPASTIKVKGAEQKRKMESMDSCIPKKPKKVGWTEKHCVLCKKHGGPHKSHNTRDCRCYNKDGTPIKKNGGAVGECGHTKVTRANKTKRKPWHWDDIHQQAFDTVKATIARDVTLAYPDYSQGFEIYTDSSKYQLGAVITQNNRPLAFFSRKLSQAQQKYSVTEQELLAIVETLKEFKGMLWGQQITVYTDHKNLMQDALGLTSDRVYRWRLLLEEYGPTIVYIKGIHNTVANAISQLDYGPVTDDRSTWMTFAQCWCYHNMKQPESSRATSEESMNQVFAN
eukprot:CCRYP_011449-RA/>CCRYP_011449-RA protein AED:0.36 eAED:0.63 QI:0/0/0/1/0/0.33/3/0/453